MDNGNELGRKIAKERVYGFSFFFWSSIRMKVEERNKDKKKKN